MNTDPQISIAEPERLATPIAANRRGRPRSLFLTGGVLALLLAAFAAPSLNGNEVVAWGSAAEGQIIGAPQPFRRIVAGGTNGFTLDVHGSISGWGTDSERQVSEVPAGGCYTAVSSGGRGYVCALREDGLIASWGDDTYTQVTNTPSGSGYIAIAAGDDWHSCALRADGSVVAWGTGDPQVPNIGGFTAIEVGSHIGYGLAADGSIVAWNLSTGALLQTPTGSGFKAISANGPVLAALDTDGSIVVLVSNAGTGDSLTLATGYLVPPTGSGFTRAVVQGKGGFGSDQIVIALAADGSITAWGTSSLGLVTEAPTGTGFSDIAVSTFGAYALSGDGTIVAWSDWASFPHGTLPHSTGFTAISANKGHAFALGPDGSIQAWGSDEGFGLISDAPEGSGYKAVATGGPFGVALALAKDGSLTAWGDNGWGQVSGKPIGSGFTAISVGYAHAYALDGTGNIVAWGQDVAGEVSNAPVGTGFTAVAAGDSFGCALAANGSITTWGSDFLGSVSGTPTGTGFVAIEAAGGNGFALDQSGAIVVWGPEGLLSDVPAGLGFTAIAVGNLVGYALAADGSIVAWGDDSGGLVSKAPSGPGFTAIAAGDQNGYALSPFRSFVPGDRLLGSPTSINETMTASFQGLKGMKLKLVFPKSATAMKSRVTVRDDEGSVVKSWKVQHKKKSKSSPKLKRTGPHTLTIETLSGTPGPIEILTSAKLPAAAKPTQTVKKGDKNQKTVTFEVLALPCAKLVTQFTPKGFFSQMALSVSRPDGTSVAVSTSFDQGVLTVAPFHAIDAGAYRFTIQGFGTEAKGKVKGSLDPKQPAPGHGTVFFP